VVESIIQEAVKRRQEKQENIYPDFCRRFTAVVFFLIYHRLTPVAICFRRIRGLTQETYESLV